MSHPRPDPRPDVPSDGDHPPSVPALKMSAWNLLLLVPLFMVFTPAFNADGPRLFGLPFFYWYQFAWVPVGVVCVGLVYVKTKDS